MKDGEILKKQLKLMGLSAKSAAKILGKKDRQSIYNYYKTTSFRDDLIDEIKKKLDIDIRAHQGSQAPRASAGANDMNIEMVTRPKGNVAHHSMEKAIANTYTKSRDVKDWIVEGESMLPNLRDGDTIRTFKVDPADIIDNYVYVVVRANGATANVKRVKNRLDTRGELILRSDNEDHDKPIHVPLDDIMEVWQVHCLVTFNLGAHSTLEQRITDIEIDIDQIKTHIKF